MSVNSDMFANTAQLRQIGIDWDDKTKSNEIFRIVSDKHKGWSKYVDRELGNYDYLLGVDVCFAPFGIRETYINQSNTAIRSTIGILLCEKTYLRGQSGC